MTEQEIEKALIEKLGDLKYTYRPDIRDRATLESNFRQHFEALNRVHLTDTEFARLLDGIVTPDVFAAAKHLRERNSFERDDGTPLYYTLVNIKDWCKNSFEVINQLRISTDYSHHRFDVILLINGIPAVQIELKTLQISPRRAITTASVKDGAKLVQAGTLLILTRGMTLLKDIPICILSRQMSFNQDVKGLLVSGDVDGRFLAYLLLGSKQRLLGLVDIAGHGTGRLDTDELKALELTLPQATEQQRIASCLASLDDLITAQTQKLAALKTHKKGLMQQLFPTLDEVAA